MGGVVLPRGGDPKGLFSAQWSVLKSYIQTTLYGLNRLYLHMHMRVFTRVCTTTIDGKEVMNSRQGGNIEEFAERKGK